MATKIDQVLLNKIADKAGIAIKTVYDRIYKIERETGLEGQEAALALAQSLGIGIKRHSTQEQRSAIVSGRPRSGHAVAPVEVAAPSTAPARRAAVRRVPKTKENTVFIVHGRDKALHDSVIDFLGAIGLQALEWNHAIRTASRGRGGNPYVNDAVTKIMDEAQAIVVLLSPDDEVRLRSHLMGRHDRSEGKSQFQARPNVLFETGIAIGAHHRKTLIVQVGDVKPFTDIGGMHILRLNDSPQSRNAFANRLEGLGCKVDKIGDRWLEAGNFAPAKPKPRRR